MENIDIQRIRQFLKEAKEKLPFVKHRVDGDSYCLISKALAFLPCETCDDSGESKASVVDDLSGGIVDTEIPCPDCQS